MTKAIPTNLITGFLGTGKTTAILHLLANKPEEETWGVLVNEFGEIGIDGALLQASNGGQSNRSDIAIREVPGGCICCVAGLPMQIALNMMIARNKPDRILIEPTGLGHPQKILDTLNGQYYRDVLDLRASICLVDPGNLQDQRYLDNQNFRDQINLADVLVANKTDLYGDDDQRQFQSFCQSLPDKKALTGWVEQGTIESEWLELPHSNRTAEQPDAHQSHSHQSHSRQTASPELVLDKNQSFLRKENTGQGHFSCGWLFSDQHTFSFREFLMLSNGLKALRFKAVVNTDEGTRGFNRQGGVVSVLELNESADNRIELINDTPMDWDDIEQKILNTLTQHP